MLQRYNENRRYLKFRGKPILSVGSAEHYGAALNADFDYKAYIDECVKHGLNQGRVFSGSYREAPGSFGIEDNTLAPKTESFLCPWKKIGEKWDLMQWDDAYWTRLREIAAYAAEREYLLEYVLFCFWYGDSMWEASPMHPANSVQGVAVADRWTFFDANGPLLEHQIALTRKAAEELRGFDNVYFEICNEPYSRRDHGYFAEWHGVIAETLRSETNALIAVNYNNSGGAMFSHLDYSFTTAHPDGSFIVTGTTPGYGGADLRAQFGFLRKTLEAERIWELQPMNEIFAWNSGAVGAVAMGHPGKRYLIYDDGDGGLENHGLGLPAGEYAIRWLDPIACKKIHAETKTHSGNYLRLPAPQAAKEAVIILTRI